MAATGYTSITLSNTIDTFIINVSYVGKEFNDMLSFVFGKKITFHLL